MRCTICSVGFLVVYKPTSSKTLIRSNPGQSVIKTIRNPIELRCAACALCSVGFLDV